MKQAGYIFSIAILIGMISFCRLKPVEQNFEDPRVLSYEVDLEKQELKLYWKNSEGEHFRDFQNLKDGLAKDGEELIFAMNGGMYQEDLTPLGLYIENGELLKRQNNVKSAHGNFYLQPNGIFYLTSDNKAWVCETDTFANGENVQYATQSGPMLLIDGEIHLLLNEGSTNLHIRNGVGILPNGNVLFAISKDRINFFEFATFFKNQGCKNALYLDGFVSRAYIPSENWEQMNSNFGVIIGATKK